jgi:hypothetical protein
MTSFSGEWLAKGGGDEGAAEEFWVAGEVVGGDFGELLSTRMRALGRARFIW